jgi:hypothetical protein
VAETVQHARACEARVTLVVLGWRSAPWWPLLCDSVALERGFAPFVRRHLFFPQAREILVHGLAFADQFCGKGVSLCDVFVLDVDFSCMWVYSWRRSRLRGSAITASGRPYGGIQYLRAIGNEIDFKS